MLTKSPTAEAVSWNGRPRDTRSALRLMTGPRGFRIPAGKPKAPYIDPRTKLRYADPEVFKQIRMLPDEYVQRYLALRNAAVVLR
ncbi:hypothetical protein GUJ93_ZPchr0015g6755 [Zizania palustris]|uniref:Vps72/YL1 C-terminal domain-containing protein n=1 Tax=Zizania palustris TaxID=103762 RepID=A0A8J5TI35_ZIZPA|nr:hypothetical protein GUJ93_ZPchr0015g6755 [Zizania palustris]